MHGVCAEEKDRARSAARHDTVDGCLELTVFDDDEFLVGVAVGGVRGLTEVERGDVTFDIRQRGRWLIKDRPAFAPDGLGHGQLFPVVNRLLQFSRQFTAGRRGLNALGMSGR